MTPPCTHPKNAGRTLSGDGQLICGACHQPIPFPMSPARCGHHGQRIPNGDHDVCAECGSALPPLPRAT